MGVCRVAIALSALLVLAACGDSSGQVTPHAYDVVNLPKNGDNSHGNAPVIAVRVMPDHKLQAMINVGRCEAPTRLDVQETPERVTLKAFVRETSDGPCPADVVPVFVPFELQSPLGGREVTDGGYGDQAVRMVDCGEQPDQPLCHPADKPTG